MNTVSKAGVKRKIGGKEGAKKGAKGLKGYTPTDKNKRQKVRAEGGRACTFSRIEKENMATQGGRTK